MSGTAKWIAEQRNIVTQLGGYGAVFRRILRECTVSTGTLVGEDKFGNKYYENNQYFLGRNRFVEFPYEGRMEYDATQIPPEWHRWMQYMTDQPPSTHPPVQRKFFKDHERNLSGTTEAYVPYSTTKPKINAWQPPSST